MGEDIKIRCVKCGSSQVYLRTKTSDYHCVKCGHNEEIKEDQ